jgi:hypothetical protein
VFTTRYGEKLQIKSQSISVLRPCHGSGSHSPASDHGGPGWNPGQCMWDLFSTKWHWNRFFSECFRCPLSVLFHNFSIPIFIYMLLLPEGQEGETWQPSRKKRSVGNTSHFLVFVRERLGDSHLVGRKFLNATTTTPVYLVVCCLQVNAKMVSNCRSC